MSGIPPEPENGGVSMESLLPLVYEELRALAGSYLRGQGSHTLQPTALVHEAFVKLVRIQRHWAGPAHFMATAAKAMRQVLVDHARKKGADKRGGSSGLRVSLEGIAGDGPGGELAVCDLNALLEDLEMEDPRAAQIAEMRIFGGMTQEESALVLEVSRTAVSNDWQFARAWLTARLMDPRDE